VLLRGRNESGGLIKITGRDVPEGVCGEVRHWHPRVATLTTRRRGVTTNRLHGNSIHGLVADRMRAAVRIIGVDHTGPEPVLVIDFGDGEERWSMDRLRAAAVGAPAWLREWVNKTTREEEAAHARRHGGWFGDAQPPPSAN
jgi:hypothetical protein